MAETMVRFTRARKDADSLYYYLRLLLLHTNICLQLYLPFESLRMCALSKVGSRQSSPLKHQTQGLLHLSGDCSLRSKVNDVRSILSVSVPIEGRNGAGFPKRENDMKHQFNMAALAKLSKRELFALKANLKAQFHTAASTPEKTAIQNSLSLIEMALGHSE